MPYVIGPGGQPMQAMPPGLAMPGAVHPMQGMPGMFPASQMAFPGMPMAPAPYGFVAPAQEGIPLQMPPPAMYSAYPPQQAVPYQMPGMGLEQQMQMQQQQQQQPPQMGNHARAWPHSNSFSRRSSSSQHELSLFVMQKHRKLVPWNQSYTDQTGSEDVLNHLTYERLNLFDPFARVCLQCTCRLTIL